jgi:hypothetical protein
MVFFGSSHAKDGFCTKMAWLDHAMHILSHFLNTYKWASNIILPTYSRDPARGSSLSLVLISSFFVHKL